VLVHSSDIHVDSSDTDATTAITALHGLQAVLATGNRPGADVLPAGGDTFENHRSRPRLLRPHGGSLGGAGAADRPAARQP